MEPQPVLLHRTVAVLQDLGEVVPGVHVQQRERHRRLRERLQRQVQHHDGVLAAGEQDHRPLELPRHLTEDVDRLGLQESRWLSAYGFAVSPDTVVVTALTPGPSR